MGHHRQLVTVEIPLGKASDRAAAGRVHHPPNGSAPPPWTAWARVRALGAHRRTTSETGYPLDRTQHDLAGGLVAKNAALTRTRFRYGGQMTLDIRSMPFPKGQHMAGFGVRVRACSVAWGWRRPKFGRVPALLTGSGGFLPGLRARACRSPRRGNRRCDPATGAPRPDVQTNQPDEPNSVLPGG